MHIASIYERVRETVVEDRYLILFSGLLFIGAGVLGAVFAEPATTSDASLSLDTSSVPGTLFFLVNNASVAALSFVGALFGCIPTVVILIFNGFSIGNAIAVAQSNTNIRVALLLVAPHGVFEFPAIWLASAAGFKIPVHFGRHLYDERYEFEPRAMFSNVTVLLGLSAVLLLVAAFIEAHLTFRVASLFL